MTNFHGTFAKQQPNFDSKWRKLEMKISLETEFSGGQDIHQNSWNFKHFSLITVSFLCRAIFFILSRRVFQKIPNFIKKYQSVSKRFLVLQLFPSLNLNNVLQFIYGSIWRQENFERHKNILDHIWRLNRWVTGNRHESVSWLNYIYI
jgi:hypothetical protein